MGSAGSFSTLQFYSVEVSFCQEVGWNEGWHQGTPSSLPAIFLGTHRLTSLSTHVYQDF